MIRVAQLIGSLRIGGAENQVAQLAAGLPQDRFEAHIIAFSEARSGFAAALPGHVRYWCMHYRKRAAIVGWLRLYRYLRKSRVDVLQCHMYHAALPGAIIARLAGVPVVITTEHGKNTWKTWWHHFLERAVITPLVDYRVAVSEDIMRLRIEEDRVPEHKIGVISNAVETDVPQTDPAAKPRVLGALGRLVDAKDYPVLIRATRLLKDQGRDIRVEIAGDGGLRGELEALIAELGLADTVRLRGIQPAGEFLASIDMFVMSSKREGVPVALLEAMARGLPIVATRVGGIPEVLQQGQDGLLCESDSPEALAESIAVMIDDDTLRVSCARSARSRAVCTYGMSAKIREWETLYETLHGKGAAVV